MQARSMQFSSSRTLPGQSYSSSVRTHSSVSLSGARRSSRPYFAAKNCRNLADVGSPFAKRGYVNREDGQPEIEILAKLLRRDSSFQVAIRRRYDARVDVDIGRAAEPVNLSLFKHAKKLRLHGRRNLAYLVQENRSSGGQFELANSTLIGAGVCAFLVTKEFILDQRVRNRSAIDGDERSDRVAG